MCVPSARYSSVCNVLRLWNISLIPTYRVYRLYDTSSICGKCSNTFVKDSAHEHCVCQLCSTLLPPQPPLTSIYTCTPPPPPLFSPLTLVLSVHPFMDDPQLYYRFVDLRPKSAPVHSSKLQQFMSLFSFSRQSYPGQLSNSPAQPNKEDPLLPAHWALGCGGRIK